MSGLVTMGVGVPCDRCKKTAPVSDAEQIKFYEEFPDEEKMYACLLLDTDNEATSIEFKYLCPKCLIAVKGYIDSITMTKAGKKTAPKKKPKKKAEPKKEAEPKEEPKAEPEKTTEPGTDFDDDSLFD